MGKEQEKKISNIEQRVDEFEQYTRRNDVIATRMDIKP